MDDALQSLPLNPQGVAAPNRKVSVLKALTDSGSCFKIPHKPFEFVRTSQKKSYFPFDILLKRVCQVYCRLNLGFYEKKHLR